MPMLVQPKKPLCLIYCIYSALVFQPIPMTTARPRDISYMWIQHGPGSIIDSAAWNGAPELKLCRMWQCDLLISLAERGMWQDRGSRDRLFLYFLLLIVLWFALPCLRSPLLYWGGTHRVAIAVCAIWEQSIYSCSWSAPDWHLLGGRLAPGLAPAGEDESSLA